MKCYIKYADEYMLIIIQDIYYKRKFRLKKYKEEYLYKKILEKCKIYNANELDVYSNKNIENFGYLFDEELKPTHTIINNNIMDKYIEEYEIKMIHKVLNDFI